MRLVLHIGTEKTGTTALQVWMHENTQALRQQGVWYAQSLGLPNNRAISVMSRASDQVEDGFHFFGLSSPEAHEAFVRQRTAAFREDVETARAAGAHTFVISNEHCQSRLRTPEMVARLGALVKPLFDEIEVVVFLRPQVDKAQSLASTGSRVGLHISKDFLKKVRPRQASYNYLDLLERWANEFGREAVTPVAFKRRPSPVAFFKEHLNLDPEAEYIPDRRVNQTLDYRVVALMNIIVGEENTGRARDLPGVYRKFFIDEIPAEQPLTLSRHEAQQIQARFDEHNRELAEAWPQIGPSDLTPDWARYPEVGTFDKLGDAELTEPLRYIFGRFNGELAMSRARVKLWESREAEAGGDWDAAVDAMSQALSQLSVARQVPVMENWAGEQYSHYENRRADLEARARRPEPEPGAGAETSPGSPVDPASGAPARRSDLGGDDGEDSGSRRRGLLLRGFVSRR